MNNETIPQGWQPEESTLKRLGLLGINKGFALSQIDPFALQINERGTSGRDIQNLFFLYVKKYWVYEQNDSARLMKRNTKPTSPMTKDWKPNEATYAILEKEGVPANVIDDVLPLFTYYWIERGDRRESWNTVFLNYIRHNTNKAPVMWSPITKDWQPSDTCLDLLQRQGISREFSMLCLAEFVVYWLDTGECRCSWNATFVAHVRKAYANEMQGYSDGYSTAAASLSRLSDTSW